MKNDKIKQQIKELIAKSNEYLNAGNKQRATAYLYIIFSLLALSFFGLFAIGPTITTISQLSKQYEEDKIALQKLKDKNAALKALSAEYVNIQEDLGLIDSAIPQAPKLAELTRQLEYLASKNNLIVQKLDTGLMELFPASNKNSALFSYTFSIGVFGLESEVNAFISEVINMGRIVGIDRLSTGRQQDNAFSASITGRAFFYKE